MKAITMNRCRSRLGALTWCSARPFTVSEKALISGRGFHWTSSGIYSPSSRQECLQPWHGRSVGAISLGTSSDRNGKVKFKELLENGSVRQAATFLDSLQPNSATEDEWRTWRGALFEAWVQHQDKLVEGFNGLDPADRSSRLSEIYLAAEAVHKLLEQLEPDLAVSNLLFASPSVETAPLGDKNTLLASPESKPRRYDIEATARCDAVLAAWAKASRLGHTAHSRSLREIPQRAQFLLERMEASSKSDSIGYTVRLQPSVESYNLVVEAWAYSMEHLRGSSAERVFRRMVSNGLAPTGESYRHVICAWALSRDRRAAFAATGHLMKMLRKLESGEVGMQPSLDDCRIVLSSWARAEDKASPTKAMSVIRLMDHAYENGLTDFKPDLECFRCVLEAASQRSGRPELGPLVDEVLVRMKELFLVPDSKCYGAAIRTWKNAALHPDQLAEHREASVRRTLTLLTEMNIAHNQSTLSVRPSAENVNDVIKALSVSSNPRRTEQAERLLASMEEALIDNSGSAVPTADTYKHVINVWHRKGDDDKVARTKDILGRLKEHYLRLIETGLKKEDVVGALNAFINICISSRARTEEEGMEILRQALSAVEMIRNLGGVKPDAETYATVLHGCTTLLPIGTERQLLIERVFQLCCEEGMVDENVLKRLLAAAPEEQYSKVVIAASRDIDGKRMVPEEWTRNALGGRVVTAEGRRATPLSIDGRLTVTRAMQEFKMRRLRDKRNRNLLQGGRLRHGKKGVPSFSTEHQTMEL